MSVREKGSSAWARSRAALATVLSRYTAAEVEDTEQEKEEERRDEGELDEILTFLPTDAVHEIPSGGRLPSGA